MFSNTFFAGLMNPLGRLADRGMGGAERIGTRRANGGATKHVDHTHKTGCTLYGLLSAV